MDVLADRMPTMDQTILSDRYSLLGVLGEGGMARVYLARDNVLDRDVALKVLREHYADDEGFVERFRREAKNAASLNHPSVVQIYDQGRAEDGTYFIAMEHMPGGTLKERINKVGPLAPAEAARIASQVVEALALAHGRGIVHRDIKPHNVLLSASGEAKVGDFGIARAATSRTMTETNLLLGTAAYMSPEHVRGERVGPQSDLYSLGVVLYEMLTGELPYKADNPIATAVKHLDEAPRSAREANPAVPETIDALTTKLLAKRAEDRYSSAAALAEDLRRISEGFPPLAAGLEERTTAYMARLSAKTRPLTAVFWPLGGSGPPASRGRQWALLIPLVALLVGMALLGVLTWALGGSTPKEQDTPEAGGAQRVEAPAVAKAPAVVKATMVKAPAVVGLSRDKAHKILHQRGLKLGAQGEAPSGDVAAGKVIEQDPAAGTKVDRGTAVGVVISTGPPREPAPRAASSSATASAAASASAASASPAANGAGGGPPPWAGEGEPEGAPPPWAGEGE